MGLRAFCNNFVLRMDMLSAQPLLRARGQSSYETFFGGVFSIMIIIAFAAIFYNTFLTVINKMEITYSQVFEDDPTSETDITSIQFAVGIDGVDLTTSPKKFKISLIQHAVSAGGGGPLDVTTIIPLQLCNISDWSSLGSNFDKQFYGFGFDKMYCLSSKKVISLYGYSGSLPYRFLNLQIKICDGVGPCDSTVNVLNYMNTFLTSKNLFKVKLFFVDTIVSPSKTKPISSIIQKNIFLSFTATTGSVGYAYFGDYTISTDQSILPYTSLQTFTGSFLDTHTSTTIPISPSAASLIQFQIYKSTRSLTISRSFGKLDTVLSYVGGLFSLLFTVIAFFFASYSQYRYEIFVAEAAFCIDSSGKKLKETDFGFMTYFRYCIYDWIKAFGGDPQWLGLKQISQVLEQVNEQLDPTLLLRRIRYLQNVSQVLLSQHKQLCLHLSALPTLEQAKQFRERINYYENILGRLEEANLNKAVNERSSTEGYQLNGSIIVEKTKGKFQIGEEHQLDGAIFQSLRKIKREEGGEVVRIRSKILPEFFQILPSEKDYNDIVGSQPNSKQLEIASFE